MQKKIVKNNMAAVLLAKENGWYTEHNLEALIFDPVVVDMVSRAINQKELLDYINSTYTDLDLKSIPSLEVKWVPNNSMFKIELLDNKETLILMKDEKWIVA